MAKVKNPVYNGAEANYTDASGTVHYIGEFIRQVMADPYPLTTVIGKKITRKSPRGHKPADQGGGSPKQLPRRQCFQQCAELWNALPDSCPDPAPCKLISSKENVWDKKTEQGVMCSYYDLYMSCCMTFCTDISITGADGDTFTGGSVPESLDCFPCIPPCLSSELSIDYTTQLMQFGETQVLNAIDSLNDACPPCCTNDDIEWEIVSGTGYLNPEKGCGTVYHAPSENANCADNATIKLSDNCGREAFLEITITMSGSETVTAYRAFNRFECYTVGGVRNCFKFYHSFNCQDEDIGFEGVPSDCGSEWNGWNCLITPCTDIPDCNPPSLPDLYDYRTEELLLSGCCPPGIQ